MTKTVFMILYKYFSTDTRVRREAKVLGKMGYKVTVLDLDGGIQSNDEYSTGVIHVSNVPFEERDKALNLILFWLRCLLILIRNRTLIDVVHAHDLTGLPPAAFLRIISPRVRVVYDSHELFPEAAKDKLSIIYYLGFLIIELLCSISVNLLIGASPPQIKYLKHRIRAESLALMNVPDLDRIQNSLEENREKRPRDISDESVLVAYSGAVLPYRGYECLMDAASFLQSRGTGNYRFQIIGDGPLLPELVEYAHRLGIEDIVEFTGDVPYEELLLKLSVADLAVGLYERTINNFIMISNKIFEYMAVGIPFVFADLPASRPILNEVGAPVIGQPFDGRAVADAILSLAENVELRQVMSERGPSLIEKKYNWGRESKKLVRTYQRVLT